MKTLRTRAAYVRPSRVRADCAHTEPNDRVLRSAHLTHRTRAPQRSPLRWTGHVASHPRRDLFTVWGGDRRGKVQPGSDATAKRPGGTPVSPVRASPPNVSHESRRVRRSSYRVTGYPPPPFGNRFSLPRRFAPIAPHGTSFVNIGIITVLRARPNVLCPSSDPATALAALQWPPSLVYTCCYSMVYTERM